VPVFAGHYDLSDPSGRITGHSEMWGTEGDDDPPRLTVRDADYTAKRISSLVNERFGKDNRSKSACSLMLCEAIKNQVVWPVMAMMRSSTMRTRPGPASDNADTGIHPGLLNSRVGYVSISRASREATLFTDDMPSSAPSSATMPQKLRRWQSTEHHRLPRESEWGTEDCERYTGFACLNGVQVQ
jgi:hypothetical protein